MSRLRCWRALLTGRFPRVSGDEPMGEFTPAHYIEFSPRERG